MVGMSMTYTLFEWAKENLDTLLEDQPESLVVEAMERVQVTFPLVTASFLAITFTLTEWWRSNIKKDV